MKKIFLLLVAMVSANAAFAQMTVEGNCGDDVKWSFDGYTLTITNNSTKGLPARIKDYDLDKRKAPWRKRNLNVRKVVIGTGITTIGSCAFASCENLQEVVFSDSYLTTIGWGAFYNCTHLRKISIPVNIKDIGTIAFAGCTSLNSVVISGRCRVGAQAFASCYNLQSIDCAQTVDLGHLAFVRERVVEGKKVHQPYDGELRRIPSYINTANCEEYGLAKASVEKVDQKAALADYDSPTSKLDTQIPLSSLSRNDTYVLAIGNQNYRFVSNVPYAIHDARVFVEYCKKTLGIPAANIHIAEDATKHMILEEELADWASSIPTPETKKLIVYYAGHGVPDIKNNNKAYILPTDVRGSHVQRGIALDDFYAQLGDLGFRQTSVFLDACFSGINRNNDGVTEGLRGVEIEAEEGTLSSGSLVVFSAAKGNETAQGYPEQGHGLFTYFLLEELNNSEGCSNFGQMADRIRGKVLEKSKELRIRKNQTPTTTSSANLADTWRDLTF